MFTLVFVIIFDLFGFLQQNAPIKGRSAEQGVNNADNLFYWKVIRLYACLVRSTSPSQYRAMSAMRPAR